MLFGETNVSIGHKRKKHLMKRGREDAEDANDRHAKVPAMDNNALSRKRGRDVNLSEGEECDARPVKVRKRHTLKPDDIIKECIAPFHRFSTPEKKIPEIVITKTIVETRSLKSTVPNTSFSPNSGSRFEADFSDFPETISAEDPVGYSTAPETISTSSRRILENEDDDKKYGGSPSTEIHEVVEIFVPRERHAQDVLWVFVFLFTFIPYIRTIFQVDWTTWQQKIFLTQYLSASHLSHAFFTAYGTTLLFVIFFVAAVDLMLLSSIAFGAVFLFRILRENHVQLEIIAVVVIFYLALVYSCFQKIYELVSDYKKACWIFLHNFIILAVVLIVQISFAALHLTLIEISHLQDVSLYVYSIIHGLFCMSLVFCWIEAMIAAVVARWCVYPETQSFSHIFGNSSFAISSFVGLAGYSLGSIFWCAFFKLFGYFIRKLSEHVRKWHESSNSFVRVIGWIPHKVAEITLGVLEKLNAYSIVYISIHGKSFYEATCSAFEMMSNYPIHSILIDNLTSYLLFGLLSGTTYFLRHSDGKDAISLLVFFAYYQVSNIFLMASRTLTVIKYEFSKAHLKLE